MEEEEYLSTGECAAKLGVSTQAINLAIKTGKLPARKIGPNYAIKEADCLAYQPMQGRIAAGKMRKSGS